MTEAFLLEVIKQYLRKEVHPHDTTDLKQTHTSIALFSTACYNSHATIIYEPDNHRFLYII